MAWMIDPAHSMIEFRAKHMMFTTVRGQFDSFQGTLDLDVQNSENSSVQGTIDVNSIDTGDDTRDNHLRSPDFFDVENHPTMTFRSTRVEPTGDNEFKVYGDLTIRGNTREIAWDVEAAELGKDPWGNPRLGFRAETKLNRKDFGLNWNVALETGGWLVSDEIKIAAEVEAVSSAEDAVETAEAETETHTT
ncbi:MAG: YceI family protein [Ardenticatenaceae bacterium]|nr:YceI family protein [Ardenticatenaceae bacterium]HBY95138.1 polyisoprenoid-binding protein [Chloroflexota bacterium]